MAMNVEGKTAIITGAGSGINLCFAIALLSKGCNVVFADLALRTEAAAVVSKYSLTSTGAKAVFQETDVRDWAQLDRMFEVAIKHFGGADIICPGAGVYEPVCPRLLSPSLPTKCTINSTDKLIFSLLYSPFPISGSLQAAHHPPTTPPPPTTPS